MTKVKICGLRRIEDIDYVNECKPDYIGFVFAKSKRQVDLQTARLLKSRLCQDIQAVGVFVNEETDSIAELLSEGIIDIAQLHGIEDNDYIRKLRNQISSEKKIIKAVRIKTKEDIQRANSYQADYILLDAFEPGNAGGTGKVFDWSMIEDMRKPFFLAGGICSDNVGAAIRKTHPYGVDLSSSLEVNDVKDLQKIKQLMNCVKIAQK